MDQSLMRQDFESMDERLRALRLDGEMMDTLTLKKAADSTAKEMLERSQSLSKDFGQEFFVIVLSEEDLIAYLDQLHVSKIKYI